MKPRNTPTSSTLITDTQKVTESNDTINKPLGFDKLESSFTQNESIKELLLTGSQYLESYLDTNFSSNEKDKIKLVMLAELEKELKLGNIISSIGKKILSPITEIAEKTEEVSSFEDLKSIKKNGLAFVKTLKSLGLSEIKKDIDTKITTLNEYKKTHPNKKFNSLGSVLSVLENKLTRKTDSQIYTEIFNGVRQLSFQLQSVKNKGTVLKKVLSDTPELFQEGVKWGLESLVKTFPFLGMIFGLIFGKDFLDKDSNDMKSSITFLQNFSKDSSFPFKNSINPESVTKLKKEELKSFFKYADKKNIDYAKSTFWKEIFTGKSKDKKNTRVFALLSEPNGKILSGKQNFSTLLKKLNNLGETEKNIQQQNTSNEIARLETEIKKKQNKSVKAQIKKKPSSTNSVTVTDREIVNKGTITKDAKTVTAEKKTSQKVVKDSNGGNDKDVDKKISQKPNTPIAKNETTKKKSEASTNTEKAVEKRMAKGNTGKEKKEQPEASEDLVKKKKAELLALKNKLRKLEFKRSLLSVGETNSIKYKGEKLAVKFNGNSKLQLGNDTYHIKLLATEHNNMNVLEKIGFDGNDVGISYKSGLLSSEDKIIETGEFGEILTALLEKKSYIKDIPGKPARISITQIS